MELAVGSMSPELREGRQHFLEAIELHETNNSQRLGPQPLTLTKLGTGRDAGRDLERLVTTKDARWQCCLGVQAGGYFKRR